MLNSKYSGLLTVLLIIIIVVVIGGLVFLGLRFFGGGETPQEVANRFRQTVGDGIDRDERELTDIEGREFNRDRRSGRRGNFRERIFCCCGNHVVVGTIEIPAINLDYPILERSTNNAIDIAVAVMHPTNPEDALNRPGNVTITGHNYRNGRFFSNNSRLALGDRIYIVDTRGERVAYTIYHIFETIPNDVAHVSRDTEGATEITLTTCTDDSLRRLIIQARAEE
ncbi:MAG: sortase [Oscillospiraceae bacterium]|nr:sortase [Oscillospiraceae bacterium]